MLTALAIIVIILYELCIVTQLPLTSAVSATKSSNYHGPLTNIRGSLTNMHHTQINISNSNILPHNHISYHYVYGHLWKPKDIGGLIEYLYTLGRLWLP